MTGIEMLAQARTQAPGAKYFDVERDAEGQPLYDVCIVGAGPAGLAAAV